MEDLKCIKCGSDVYEVLEYKKSRKKEIYTCRCFACGEVFIASIESNSNKVLEYLKNI
jgi:uncharacterized Zn finger protein